MHHSFIIPGLVDGAVVKAQAIKRANQAIFGTLGPEETIIHFHEEGTLCSEHYGDVPCYKVPIGAQEKTS